MADKGIVDKRIAILEATLSLISERGFHATPVSMIAKEAGVSAGIIYHYFPSKEVLINELYAETKIEIIEAMLDAYSEDNSLNERFYRIWFSYTRFNLDYPNKGMFLEQFENSPLIKHTENEEFIQAIAPLFNFVQQGIDAGIFKPLPPMALFDLGFSPAVALVKRHIAGVIVLDDELMQAAANACWDAVKK